MPVDRTRPTLIYDGDCGFCRRSVDLLQRWDREQRIALVPFQDQARVAAFGIPLPALAAAMHLILPPPDGQVRVKMTLTSPGCPAGPMITNDAYRVLRGLEGVKDVDIEIVWEPYWTPERMDPKVRALMGL